MIHEIISKNQNKNSNIFGSLINDNVEFEDDTMKIEQDIYEVIVGFWFNNVYFELVEPNSSHKRFIRFYYDFFYTDSDVIREFEKLVNPKLVKVYDFNNELNIVCMLGVTIDSIKDFVVFEIGEILI